MFGLTPLEAGIWTMPWALTFVVGTFATSLITRWVRPTVVMAGGLVVAAAGFLLLTQVDVATGLGTLVSASVVVALGLAPVFTLATDQVIGSAPVERAGAAAALSETSSEFGGALGIAILGSVGAAVYRTRVTDARPTSVAPEFAAAARNTLAGAVAVADQLPGAVRAEVLDAARQAFAQAFDVTAVLTAAIAVFTAAMVVMISRDDSADDRSPSAQPALATAAADCDQPA